MSVRRMIDSRIILSDIFRSCLTSDARALYCELIMVADDAGIIDNIMSVMMGICHYPMSALDSLMQYGYVARIGDQYIIVRHWWEHNHLKYRPQTDYPDVLAHAITDGVYVGIDGQPNLPQFFRDFRGESIRACGYRDSARVKCNNICVCNDEVEVGGGVHTRVEGGEPHIFPQPPHTIKEWRVYAVDIARSRGINEATALAAINSFQTKRHRCPTSDDEYIAWLSRERPIEVKHHVLFRIGNDGDPHVEFKTDSEIEDLQRRGYTVTPWK